MHVKELDDDSIARMVPDPCFVTAADPKLPEPKVNPDTVVEGLAGFGFAHGVAHFDLTRGL